MKVKVFAAAAAACMLLRTPAFASVLGTESGGWETDMGAATVYHQNTFVSSEVGRQTENYIEYKPNADAKPVVINGYSVWGTRSLSSAVSYMYDNGSRPIAGVNADYFSFTTGIPMGNTIIDGEIVSSENMGQDGVAFRSDGSAFIDWVDIQTTVSDGTSSVDVDCINKWYQNGYDPIFMLTDKFASSTHTSCECLFVICTPVSGRLAIGSTAEYVVNDSFVYEGDVEIPEGKAVLLIATGGIPEHYAFLNNLKAGQTITVTNSSADGDNAKWSDVKQLVSSAGGRIIKNGELGSVTDNQAAPRTAVGVRPDGSSIFYTLDGRQSGYSYGAQIETVARRLMELGCTDAVNLDGGGSTSIGALFPGTDEFVVMNSPSDGSLRNVANFLFIRDDRTRTDIPGIINADDEAFGGFLSGMTHKAEILSVYDTANYKMENPKLTYTIENGSGARCSVDADGVIRFEGEGTAVLRVTGGEAGISREYKVYETPEEIRVYNSEDWKEIDAIYTEANEELQLNLAAAAFVGGEELNAYDGLFNWSIEGDIGSVNDEGIFTLADTANKSGKILVRAGNLVKEIPVTIADYPRINPFADTAGHWAQNTISAMAEYGILKGMEENGGLYFHPDANMTRAQFASMICNYMGLDTGKYANMNIGFADYNDIQLWAVPCVKAAYTEGLMTGRGESGGNPVFAPEDSITRAEAMTIIARMLNMSGGEAVSFTDESEIPAWAADGISALVSGNIVNGYDDGSIRPNNNVTRAEAAAMMLNVKNNQ